MASYRVVVRVNADGVVLPNGNLYNTDDEVELTDSEYLRIDPALIGGAGLVTVIGSTGVRILGIIALAEVPVGVQDGDIYLRRPA